MLGLGHNSGKPKIENVILYPILLKADCLFWKSRQQRKRNLDECFNIMIQLFFALNSLKLLMRLSGKDNNN